MQNDIRCPWCGSHMTMNDNRLMYPGDQAMLWWYECDCTICKATSPNGDSPEEATELALRRVAEPNRVLTLAEAKSYIAGGIDVPSLYMEPCVDLPISRWQNGLSLYLLMKDDLHLYNRSYRLWRHKPTDEERANTPWEVQDGD